MKKYATFNLPFVIGKGEILEILPSGFDIRTKYTDKAFRKLVPILNQERYILLVDGRVRIIAKDKIYKVSDK